MHSIRESRRWHRQTLRQETFLSTRQRREETEKSERRRRETEICVRARTYTNARTCIELTFGAGLVAPSTGRRCPGNIPPSDCYNRPPLFHFLIVLLLFVHLVCLTSESKARASLLKSARGHVSINYCCSHRH